MVIAPTLNTDEIPVRLDILFGHVEIQTRMRREGNRIIGEGRSLDYDGAGVLRKDTGWQPTGVVMEVWDEWPEQPRRWWEFWR